jgi:hypothetical protein
MGNHKHLIRQVLPENIPEQLQRSFLRYTAQQIRYDLQKHLPKVLELFYAGSKDRSYLFWKRNPLSVELFGSEVMNQKLDYIHENPVKENLCKMPENYKYSSANHYETGASKWDWLSHLDG